MEKNITMWTVQNLIDWTKTLPISEISIRHFISVINRSDINGARLTDLILTTSLPDLQAILNAEEFKSETNVLYFRARGLLAQSSPGLSSHFFSISSHLFSSPSPSPSPSPSLSVLHAL